MKLFIYVFAVLFLFVFSATAQTVSKTEPVLHVEVENGQTLDLKASDLAKFPRREVKATGHDEKESVFSGYSLSDILLAASAKIGAGELRGKELSSYLLVEAADGYKATFAIAEIAPEFTDRIILLADMRDGKPFEAKTGTWQIIVPGEKKHGRWVRQVIKLSVKSAGSQSASTSKLNNLDDNDFIRSIVFKKIVEPWNSPSHNEVKVYCFSVDGGKDPSEVLLKDLSQFKVPVKKISNCLVSSGDGSVESGRGVLFSTSELHWKGKDEVVMSAGSQIGNMGADGCDYTLKRDSGVWKIALVEKCSIS